MAPNRSPKSATPSPKSSLDGQTAVGQAKRAPRDEDPRGRVQASRLRRTTPRHRRPTAEGAAQHGHPGPRQLRPAATGPWTPPGVLRAAWARPVVADRTSRNDHGTQAQRAGGARMGAPRAERRAHATPSRNDGEGSRSIIRQGMIRTRPVSGLNRHASGRFREPHGLWLVRS